MDALKLIEELEREIERDKAALAVKEKLVAEWRVKYNILKNVSSPSPLQQDKPKSEIPNTGIIDLSSLPDIQPKKSTIVDEVKEIIERFGTQEFTVQHVDSVLKQHYGLPPEDTSQRTRISTALSRLKDAGLIDLTFKGAGNIPNRYVVVQRKDEDEDHE